MINGNPARWDIDILRGIAVILVVLYHLEVELFKSGFIGVDIFFVLSGYLIGSIYSQHQGVIDFYDRRLRRILPAMLVTLLLLFLVSPLLFLPFEVKKIVDSIIGTLMLVPNIIFWRDNDYFSNLDFSPLLHYWSLGIELQYYVIFPFLFCFFSKSRLFLPAATVFSLIVCVVLTDASAKSAFFLLPARLWEFFVGYLAYAVRDSRLVKAAQFNRHASSFSLMLLVALFVVAMLPIPSDQFPGWYALFPVLFSFLYIVVGLRSSKILDSSIVSIVRWIAKVSFSVYLIHFPVIFVFKYGPFSQWEKISSVESLLCIVVTLLLSFLSFKYIESPFRDRKRFSFGQFFIFVAVMYILIIAVIFIFSSNRYFSGFYSKEKQDIFYAMTDRGAWRCTKLQKLKEFGAKSCSLFKGANDSKSFYLVGDSHMDALKEIFVKVAKERNVSVRLNRERCLLGVDQCSAVSVINEVNKYNITDVVMHGYRYALFNYEDLNILADWLRGNNIRFHIIGPVPDYNDSIPAALYEEAISHKKVIRRQTHQEFLQMLPSGYTQFVAGIQDHKNFYGYHPENILCSNECLLSSDQGVFYFDSNHLTMTGAAQLELMVEDVYSK